MVLFFPCRHDCGRAFIVATLTPHCLAIFHSTDTLSFWGNSLTGTIPNQIGFLTNLGESSGCVCVSNAGVEWS